MFIMHNLFQKYQYFAKKWVFITLKVHIGLSKVKNHTEPTCAYTVHMYIQAIYYLIAVLFLLTDICT